MTKPDPVDFFTKELSQAYDERNSKLSAISENMHFLIRLILKDLPPTSRILCVGVGTGAEIFSLAKAFPQSTFVGVDPSASMLEVCGERLKKAGMENRCTLIHGYVHDVELKDFDAALSVLVGHFVKREDRLEFLQNMTRRLKKEGYLINTELSFDLNSAEFPLMIEEWKKIQSLMGGTPESLAQLPTQLRETLAILPPTDTENLLRQSGVKNPTRFFQSFMIHGWFGRI